MTTFQAMKQVDAVVQAVKSILGDDYNPAVKVELSKDQRQEVIALISQGLSSDTIQMSAEAKAKHTQANTIKTYASGLLTNWLAKSKELNGNIDYAPLNPGSRSNPQLKQALELKAYLESIGQDTTPVDTHIATLEAVKPTKTKTLDLSALPPELQALVG
jgi:hypothetical protein